MKVVVLFELGSLVVSKSKKEYIVVLNDGISLEQYKNQNTEIKIKEVFPRSLFEGYVTELYEEEVEDFKNREEHRIVEENGRVELSMVNRRVVQRNAPWGLSRIAQRENGKYGKFEFDFLGGQDVLVYVIDTGININHQEFEGRAKWGAMTCHGWSNSDTNGHGTHVAGIIGAHTWGVAKQVSMIAVKVFCDEDGSFSDIINGIGWAVNDGLRVKMRFRNIIFNLSLDGGLSEAMNLAIEKAYRSGFLCVVAAGNKNQPACQRSPASSRYSLTVGSTTVNDFRSGFSNHGKCVKIWGPGSDIVSTWIGSNHATYVESGTSMAAPFVAGTAAYLATFYNFATPKQLWDTLIDKSSKGYIYGLDSQSPNQLLYNDF